MLVKPQNFMEKFCLDKHMSLYMMKAKMKMKIELEEGVLKSFIQVCVWGGGVYITSV